MIHVDSSPELFIAAIADLPLRQQIDVIRWLYNANAPLEIMFSPAINAWIRQNQSELWRLLTTGGTM